MDRNEFRERVLAALDQYGLTVADFTVLNHLHYCDRPKQALVRFASCPDYSLGLEISRRQTAGAVRRLLRRGLLREVSVRDVRCIASDLKQSEVLGPIYGLPMPGNVQFTIEGARIWNAISAAMLRYRNRGLWGPRGFAYTDVVKLRTRWFFACKDSAETKRKELGRMEDVVEVTPSQEMDGFQIHKWCRQDSGWRFDCVQRFQWQGWCGSSGASTVTWTAPTPVVDRRQLSRLLARRELDCAAWSVLLTLGQWGPYPRCGDCRPAIQMARSLFRVSAARTRVAAAIRRLYSLRIIHLVNSHTGEPILIEPMPVDPTEEYTDKSRRRAFYPAQLDLSPTGAQYLQELGPAIYGPSWLGSWSVEREVCRTEHRYGETLGDIAMPLSEYDRESERVLSIGPVTPVGPWCVKWWQRYDKGYRIEIEIGEPVEPETASIPANLE